jgi:hypothetical protein
MERAADREQALALLGIEGDLDVAAERADDSCAP